MPTDQTEPDRPKCDMSRIATIRPDNDSRCRHQRGTRRTARGGVRFDESSDTVEALAFLSNLFTHVVVRRSCSKLTGHDLYVQQHGVVNLPVQVRVQVHVFRLSRRWLSARCVTIGT